MKQQEVVKCILLVLGLDEVFFYCRNAYNSFGLRKSETILISPFFNFVETQLKFPFYRSYHFRRTTDREMINKKTCQS